MLPRGLIGEFDRRKTAEMCTFLAARTGEWRECVTGTVVARSQGRLHTALALDSGGGHGRVGWPGGGGIGRLTWKGTSRTWSRGFPRSRWQESNLV